METAELYENLERLVELKKKVEGRKLEMGCLEAREYNDIMDSLPKLFSIDNLIKYHEYAANLVGKEKAEELGRSLREKILEALREVSTSESFEDLRRIVQSA